jgi:hypothetical protein
MLPHFPKAHKEMSELRNAQIFDAMWSASPILSEMRVRPQREGTSSSFEDEGGRVRAVEYQQRSVSTQHRLVEGRGMTMGKFLETARQPGRELGKLMILDVFQVTKKAVQEVGNVMDAGGRELTFDLLLDGWERIQIDFGPDGKPHLPSIVVGSEAYAELQRKIPEWEKDPRFRARLEEIMRRKREDFCEREACRRLVD